MAAKGKGSKADKKLEAYKKAFKVIDKNNDGFISFQEMTDLLRKEDSHMPKAAIEDTFSFFDDVGDKKITFEEFCKGLDAIAALIEGLLVLFNQLDADKSGYLDKEELTKVLQQGEAKFSDEDINLILKQADINNDNKISFDEFTAAIV